MALNKTDSSLRVIESTDVNKVTKTSGQAIITDDGQFYYDNTQGSRLNLSGSKLVDTWQSPHVAYPGDVIKYFKGTNGEVTLFTANPVFFGDEWSASYTDSSCIYTFTNFDNKSLFGWEWLPITLASILGNCKSIYVLDRKGNKANVSFSLTGSSGEDLIEQHLQGTDAIEKAANLTLSWSITKITPDNVDKLEINCALPYGKGIYEWDGYRLYKRPDVNGLEEYRYDSNVYVKDEKLLTLSDLTYNYDSSITSIDALLAAPDRTSASLYIWGDYSYYSEYLPWDNSWAISGSIKTGSEMIRLPVDPNIVDLSKPLKFYNDIDGTAVEAGMSTVTYVNGWSYCFEVVAIAGSTVNSDNCILKSPYDSFKYVKIPLQFKLARNSQGGTDSSSVIVGKHICKYGYTVFEQIQEQQVLNEVNPYSDKPVQSKAIVEYVKNNLSTVYRYKGSTSNLSTISNVSVGDVYNLTQDYFSEEAPNYSASLIYGVSTSPISGNSSDHVMLYNNSRELLTNLLDYAPSGSRVNIIAIDENSKTFYVEASINAGGFLEDIIIDSQTATINAGTIYEVKSCIVTYNLNFKAGDNAVWTGYYWDALSSTVDLSSYAKKTDISKVFRYKGKISNNYINNH